MPTIFAAQIWASGSHSLKLLLLRAKEREKNEEEHPGPESRSPLSGLSSKNKLKVLRLIQFLSVLSVPVVFFHSALKPLHALHCWIRTIWWCLWDTQWMSLCFPWMFKLPQGALKNVLWCLREPLHIIWEPWSWVMSFPTECQQFHRIPTSLHDHAATKLKEGHYGPTKVTEHVLSWPVLLITPQALLHSSPTITSMKTLSLQIPSACWQLSIQN